MGALFDFALGRAASLAVAPKVGRRAPSYAAVAAFVWFFCMYAVQALGNAAAASFRTAGQRSFERIADVARLTDESVCPTWAPIAGQAHSAGMHRFRGFNRMRPVASGGPKRVHTIVNAARRSACATAT